jgi:hypothetical protein
VGELPPLAVADIFFSLGLHPTLPAVRVRGKRTLNPSALKRHVSGSPNTCSVAAGSREGLVGSLAVGAEGYEQEDAVQYQSPACGEVALSLSR